MATHLDAYTLSTIPDTVLVIAAGRWVALDAEDWHRLAQLGGELNWTVAKSGGEPVPFVRHPLFGVAVAARLIVGATERQQVRYRGEPWDLRRENLVVVDRYDRHPRRVPLPVLH